MGARRRLLAIGVVGLTVSLSLAACRSEEDRPLWLDHLPSYDAPGEALPVPDATAHSTVAPSAASTAHGTVAPSAGFEFKGPAHVTDTVWKFDGMATADLMFNADGSVLYVDFWYEIASGKAFFGFSGVADPVAGTLRFETCPSNYGQAGPMPATGSGTYTPTQASGSGSCKNYQRWKGGSDGDLTFSFDGIPRVVK